jgi:hypothetical protein
MFARKLTLQLKPSTVDEFTKTLETQVIPTLRKVKGFRDELVFVGPNAKEAFAISLWDAKENAEVYGRDFYPEIAKTMAKIVDGTPQLMTYEVVTTTLPMKTATVTA